MRKLLFLPAFCLLLTGCPEDVPEVTCTWQQPGGDIEVLAAEGGLTLRIAVTGTFTGDDLPAVHFFSDLDGKLLESGIAISDSGCAVDGCPAGDRYEGSLSPGRHRFYAQALTPLAAVACEAEAAITVNTPPTVADILFSPAAPGTDDDIEVTATASDADGDAVTLTAVWAGPDGQELLGEVLTNINTSTGQTWTVTVTPRDGLDAGAPLTAELVIGNTPPQMPSVAIGPDPGREDAVLSCWVTDLDDLDPDDPQTLSVSWSWTVNGDDAEVTEGAVTPDLITAGDDWVCSAVVNDGEDDSPPGSAATTVIDALTVPGSIDLEGQTVLQGTNASQFTGDVGTVGSPGDIDGDGLAEFIITVNDEVCPLACDGRGYAYLFAGGGPAGDGIEDATATFIGPVGFKLYAPWPIGDVNGDGIDDLILPHRSVIASLSEGGSAVFIVFGSADGFVGEIVLDDLTETGAATRIKNREFETMGSVPCPLGDLDGDGYADLGLAAPDADLGTGRLYIIYGHPGVWLSGLVVTDLTPGFRIVGAGAGQSMAHGCAGPIDIDGNGYDDIVVAAPGAAAAGQGRVLIYLMDEERLSGEFTSVAADIIIDGDPASAGQFGLGLAALGDHDGDGLDDFAIFEIGPELVNADPPPINFLAGSVHIVSPGHSSFLPGMSVENLPYHIVGDGNLGFCGQVTGVDLDGDGLGDLVCGDSRPQAAEGLGGPAQVRIFFGGTVLAEHRSYDDADVVLNSPTPGDLAGISVVGVHDRDGDGYDELLVGAPKRDGPLTDSGAVYLINFAD
jgi:hypothetical protein